MVSAIPLYGSFYPRGLLTNFITKEMIRLKEEIIPSFFYGRGGKSLLFHRNVSQ